MNSNKIIAIIPARSGSKSIKDKNIIELGGKPLIAWSIESCFRSKLISKVYVSTDSKKYAKIAKQFGPVEILLRPKKISTDFSTDYQMIRHAIENIDYDYDYIVHIRPTTPIRKTSELNAAIKNFINSKFTSLRSVHEMSETSYKSVEVNRGILRSLKNLNFTIDELNAPRQKFNKTYSPNGVIDIYKKNFVKKNKKLFGNKVKAFKTSYAYEIDNKEDFNYIEFLWKKKL
jgi:CMP-N,N'-diacetyllegionaminic acid synthase